MYAGVEVNGERMRVGELSDVSRARLDISHTRIRLRNDEEILGTPGHKVKRTTHLSSLRK